MELFENMVFQYLSEENKKIRIIYIDKPSEYCYIVALEGDTAMPQLKFIQQIHDLIQNEEVIVVPEPYPQVFSEEDIPYKYRTLRDRRWSIVDYVWNENKKQFLDKATRGETIVNASNKFNESERRIKRIITRFFQRGMKKNALLDDYRYSGGAGMLKECGSKKRGRKRAPGKNGEIVEGINIDEMTLNILSVSFKLFYLKKEKKSLAESYTYMLKKFYSDKIIYNNTKKSYVWDKSRIPTYRQFVYWYHVFEDKKESIIKRNSEKDYQLKNRNLLSNSD